jgi:hypothetical protein
MDTFSADFCVHPRKTEVANDEVETKEWKRVGPAPLR